jgi:hypothetical protein
MRGCTTCSIKNGCSVENCPEGLDGWWFRMKLAEEEKRRDKREKA